MPGIHRLTLATLVLLCSVITASATDYFVNASLGNDENAGTDIQKPIRTLSRASGLPLQPGDRLLLAAGQSFAGSLQLFNITGTAERPVIVTSYGRAGKTQMIAAPEKFNINAKSMANGIWLKNCRYVQVSQASIRADGYEGKPADKQSMRVAVLVSSDRGKESRHILLDSLDIHDIYFENKGYIRGHDEVKTANGTQRYGWGIRLMATEAQASIGNITIAHCRIRDVSHTGIKLTGNKKNVYEISIHHNDVAFTGGPGIQMSEVRKVHVHHNTVDHSGSDNDGRKWGRGSGLWTWSASEVLIEQNRFTYANGPGDSAGAHIDFNCDNVVMQYNFSAWNAGGFCEILGNNYNCAYRFNISVNDGYRKKGEHGAFQEGKIFWLSGYQGENRPRKGPVNSYFYNNTIYVDSSITARIAIDGTSSGILIANNIFCIKGNTQYVLGDQYKADDGSAILNGPIVFKNNLWLTKTAWPAEAGINDTHPLMGDPLFPDAGGLAPENYLPQNTRLVQFRGIAIEKLPGDEKGLMNGLQPGVDIRGKAIGAKLPLGALMPD